MLLPVTVTYLFVLAFLFVLLSYNVIKLRGAHAVAFGDAGNDELKRAIAAHSNFAQYVPIMMLILALCEASGVNPRLCFMLGFLMLFGRVSHIYGVLIYETHGEEGKDPFRFRKVGMIATFAAITISSIFLLLNTYGAVI